MTLTDSYDNKNNLIILNEDDYAERLNTMYHDALVIARIKKALYSGTLDYQTGGQGVVFHSLTDYFQKDRESYQAYLRYPMRKHYTKFTRRTVRATKQPVRMAGWRGRR